jgi:hypothetical protein
MFHYQMPAAKAYKFYKYSSNITPRMASRRDGYRWGPGCYVRVNSRPAHEAPNSALGSFEGNPYCEFQDGSSDSPSGCRLWGAVVKGIPEPQGLLGSSSGYDR